MRQTKARLEQKRKEKKGFYHGYTKSTFVPRETMRTSKGIVCVPTKLKVYDAVENVASNHCWSAFNFPAPLDPVNPPTTRMKCESETAAMKAMTAEIL